MVKAHAGQAWEQGRLRGGAVAVGKRRYSMAGEMFGTGSKARL